MALSAGAALFVVDAFIPGPLYTFPSITNPVGIGGAVGDILGMLDTLGLVVLQIALTQVAP